MGLLDIGCTPVPPRDMSGVHDHALMVWDVDENGHTHVLHPVEGCEACTTQD